ncbi:response regulator [Candidatus Binatus soli]|jgi:PAS domain S-box-containing protein|uniref:PAS domain-containing response regulator n=1 Tax=Candidatus Binatus soli TaxID=1953413 RepID=UPI003D0B23EA
MDLLLVENHPTDRMLIQARLRRAFPSARILAADGPLHFNEHLKRDNCDIVVTDYWLGWIDGLSVLQRVRERWPRTRVIMLTGNGGEEVAASAFKHGLYQYLLKPDGFDELVAVAAAAMESKRREDFHELMAMIVNSFPDGVHSVDAAGIITATNAAARQIYGYEETEIVGRTNEILLPAGRRGEIRRLHERAFGGEIVPRFSTLQVRRDGAEIAVAMTIVPMRDGAGAVSNVACITTPKQEERLEGAYRSPPPRLALST